MTTEAVDAALAERDDLDIYKSAKRSLFALQLFKSLDDIHTVAASALTDGPDDKACDVIYVDRDTNCIVLIQGYESGAPEGKTQAPGSKAASIHQAVNWLLGDHAETDVPERLRSSRKEVHEALADGAIDAVELWFVHNLPESKQIHDELQAAATAAKSVIAARYDGAEVDVFATEVGAATLSERYLGSKTPILITDTFAIPVTGAFTEEAENWRAICTSLDSEWLREQFSTYQERLFSANIRGYLGSARSQGNINNGIQATARNEPGQFWAYNNGITALVHEFSVNADSTEITVRGLTIVNGAQTTGALGSLKAKEAGHSRILARFIKCDDPQTVQEIIRYNNRQNPTQASDFRSNDRIQSRLVKEFEQLGVVGYTGGRRGGAEDVIRRPGTNQIQASVAAQSLAAFHGKPDVAYHQKGQIWEADAIYSTVFPERVTARHILLTCALLRAVEDEKAELTARDATTLSQAERDLSAWFSLRGSTMLAVTAVGAVAEAILGQTMPDAYALRFADEGVSLQDAVDALRPTLAVALALAPSQLTAPLVATGALRNKTALDAALDGYRALFNATVTMNRPVYDDLAARLSINAS